MSNTLTPDTFRELMREFVAAYGAIRTVQALGADAERLLRAAEAGLQKASVTLLPSAQLNAPFRSAPCLDDVATAQTQFVQQFAELHVALYETGKQMLDDDKTLEGGLALLEALLKITSDYRDGEAWLGYARALQKADAHLKLEEHKEARAVLNKLAVEFRAKTPTQRWLRQSYLAPAQAAIEAQDWETARAEASAWLVQSKDDKEMRELLRSAYALPVQAALNAKDWPAARRHAEGWLKLQPDDAEMRAWLRQSYLGLIQVATQAGEPIEVIKHADAGLAHWPQDAELLRLKRDVFLQHALGEMVRIPAGEFLYGEDKRKLERERQSEGHSVVGEFLYGEDKRKLTLPEFYIGKLPVTTAQFLLFVRDTGFRGDSHWDKDNDAWLRSHLNYPAVNVSWEDAQAFCRWASAGCGWEVRLPTEQEWEKAARGTDGRAYPWGKAAPNAALANYDKSYDLSNLMACGSWPKNKSPYGCLDMAGNVWEWTQGVWASNAWARVVRGGAFNYNDYNLRCAARDDYDATLRGLRVGFRVVASPI